MDKPNPFIEQPSDPPESESDVAKKKSKRYSLTCYEDSESYEPGLRTLAEFEDDPHYPSLGYCAKSKAIDYCHDLLIAVTDSRFSLFSELKKMANEINDTIVEESKGKCADVPPLSTYNLPLSIVNLLLDKYNLELEEH